MSTKLKKIPLPAGLAPLPKGAVYLGEIPQMPRPFAGWLCRGSSHNWSPELQSSLKGGIGHYAAPRNSAIAREILGVKPKKKAHGEAVIEVQKIFRDAKKAAKKAPAKKRVRVKGLPSYLPQDLPPVPRGYDHWEYGGKDSKESLELSCALLIQDDGSDAWEIVEHHSHIRTPFCIPVKRVQRTKQIGVMPAPARPSPALGKIPWVEECAKFGDNFAASARLRGIALPDWLPALPPVPPGFDRWEPRGMGWESDFGVCYAYTQEDMSHRWGVFERPNKTTACEVCFYIEAVPDEKAEDAIAKAHATLDAYSPFMERPFDAPVDNSAVGLLNEAAATIGARAAERDVDSERSMAKCVAAFNVMFGKDITEEQGWLFMVLLKMSRSTVGHRRDDFLDGASYISLAGECALKDK